MGEDRASLGQDCSMVHLNHGRHSSYLGGLDGGFCAPDSVKLAYPHFSHKIGIALLIFRVHFIFLSISFWEGHRSCPQYDMADRKKGKHQNNNQRTTLYRTGQSGRSGWFEKLETLLFSGGWTRTAREALGRRIPAQGTESDSDSYRYTQEMETWMLMRGWFICEISQN